MPASTRGGVIRGLEAKIRTGKIEGELAVELGDWCRQLSETGTTHEDLVASARLMIGKMQASVQGAEKADLEEARQAFKQALEKGTSMAFRKIKKEGMQQWVEAGGVIKSYALHDQLEGQQNIWAKLWKHTGEKGKAWTYVPSMANELQPLSMEEFRGAARSFKASTSAVGGWHPRQMGNLAMSSPGCWCGWYGFVKCQAYGLNRSRLSLSKCCPKQPEATVPSCSSGPSSEWLAKPGPVKLRHGSVI